jgi:hypothetical protein
MGNSFDPIKSSLGPANCPRGNLSFILALSARESFRLPIQAFARKKGATVSVAPCQFQARPEAGS